MGLYSFSLEGYRGERGIRHGDPLFLYLFLVAINALSRILEEAAQCCVFKYHPKCLCVKISHLSFADDFLIFAKGSVDSVVEEVELIRSITGFKIGQLLVRYFGVPLVSRKLTFSDCSVLIGKILSKHIQSILAEEGSPWIAWIKEYVMKRRSFWDVVPNFTSSWKLKELAVGSVQRIPISILNWLPTRDHLSSFGLNVACFVETRNHIFFEGLGEGIAALQLEQEMETVIKVLQPGPLGIIEHKFSAEEIREANATNLVQLVCSTVCPQVKFESFYDMACAITAAAEDLLGYTKEINLETFAMKFVKASD
ncbi:hypothetical protein PVK06_042213 [Gossypium arboreum]|uniref:Reverse transcriptase domain-containing protein n=1 Tax=Gossypium arboreum TaxID=29729 RepID=A0ABR0MK77_GOSAR|nr:hypothetical protein PVK06_042213 [Gossypium arboreum]